MLGTDESRFRLCESRFSPHVLVVAKRLLQVDNKRVVRVLVGSTWLDAEQGTYSTKKSGNESGFSFTDPHSGRVVSGPVASVTAVKYEPKKQ